MDDIYDCMFISLPLIISSILFSAFIYYCPEPTFEDNFFILPKPTTNTSKTIQPIPSIPTNTSKTIQPIPPKPTNTSKTTQPITPKPSTSKKIVITLPNIKEENNLVIIYKLPFNNNICIKKCMCIKKLLSEYKELNFDCSDDCEFIILDDEDECVDDEDECVDDEDECDEDECVEDECVEDEDECVEDENECVEDENECVEDENECVENENECVEDEDECVDECVDDEDECVDDEDECVDDEDECVDDEDECVDDEDECVEDECVDDEDECVDDEDECVDDEDECVDDEEINSHIGNIQLKKILKKIEYLTNNIKCNMEYDDNLTNEKKAKLNSIIKKIKNFTKNADDTKILPSNKYKEKIELIGLLKNFKLD
jgi:hypothetical protein